MACGASQGTIRCETSGIARRCNADSRQMTRPTATRLRRLYTRSMSTEVEESAVPHAHASPTPPMQQLHRSHARVPARRRASPPLDPRRATAPTEASRSSRPPPGRARCRLPCETTNHPPHAFAPGAPPPSPILPNRHCRPRTGSALAHRLATHTRAHETTTQHDPPPPPFNCKFPNLTGFRWRRGGK